MLHRDTDDEVQEGENVNSIGAFFRGEWMTLWPVFLIGLIAVAVIVWDRAH